MRRSLLLIVDMLSDYSFPDAERLLERAPDTVATIRRARDRADELGVPVAYANDIHDRWQCSREGIYTRALQGARPDLVSSLQPRDGDAFIFKGQHSAFYGTPLAHLLHQEEIEEIVLTGQVTEQCILYTALDAHVRRYSTTVLRDAVLSLDDELRTAALTMMDRNMGATIVDADEWPARA